MRKNVVGILSNELKMDGTADDALITNVGAECEKQTGTDSQSHSQQRDPTEQTDSERGVRFCVDGGAFGFDEIIASDEKLDPHKFNMDTIKIPVPSLTDNQLGNGEPDYSGMTKGQARREKWKYRIDYILGPSSTNRHSYALFRSSQSMVNEKARQKNNNRYIIHPFSKFRALWDVIMMLILILTIIILPIEVAFFSTDLWDLSWKIFNLSLDTIFLIDIIINLRTGFVRQENDAVIITNKEIIKHYMKGWFLIDFVASVPFDYIVLSVTSSASDQDAVKLASTLRALRLIKLVSLLRILRLVRLVRYMEKIREMLNVGAKFVSIVKLVVLIFVFAHWNACIQYLVAYIEGFPETSWVSRANLNGGNGTKWAKYSHSLYRSMSHMISIGYGWSPPRGTSEIWMTLISMMSGASFYALFIAHISAIVMSMYPSSRHYEERVCEVKDYMRYRRLPHALQKRVLDYYEYKYQHKYFDEHSILNERHMSYPLRKDILMHNGRSLVQTVPFLTNAPSEFLVEVILKLHMHVYFPGELIVQAGKKGDGMYFIEHGAVSVHLPSGEVVNVLRDGTHFGEIALLFQERRVASVITKEVCYIYRLSKSDFDEVLSEYPKMRQVMINVARERLGETKKKLGLSLAPTVRRHHRGSDAVPVAPQEIDSESSDSLDYGEDSLGLDGTTHVDQNNSNQNNNNQSNNTQSNNNPNGPVPEYSDGPEVPPAFVEAFLRQRRPLAENQVSRGPYPDLST